MKYRFGSYEVEPRERSDQVVLKLVKFAGEVDRRVLMLVVVSAVNFFMAVVALSR